MKLKSIVTKSIATATFTIAGIAAVNTFDNNDAQAATGQVLAANTNWKIIQTAYDSQGNKWYDLGDNQWVKVLTASVKTSST